MKLIIYNPRTNLFDFFVDALKYDFLKKNIETTIFLNNDYDKQNDPIIIIVNPHFIFDEISIYNEINMISNTFKYKILYITEPINFTIEKKVYLQLINIIKPYSLWTYTKSNFFKLNTYISHFKIFPNYNEAYNFTNIDNIKYRNIENIIFFGNINENRKIIASKFNTLINKTNMWSKNEWKNILDNYLFYLNIHRRINCHSFEAFRIIPILANGGVIFSELCNEEEMKLYSKYNIIFADRNLLLKTFHDYIQNIDYQQIYEKAFLFRNDINHNDEINDFINFHIKL